MIKRISDFFAKRLIQNSIILQEDKVLYEFGVKVLIWHILHISIVVILGLVFDRFFETFFFVILYSILRKYAGGYHAKSEINCLLCSFIVVIFANIFLDFLLDNDNMISSCLFLIFCGIIWKLAPVDNENRPLSSEERCLYALKCKIVLISLLILYILLLLLIPQYSMVIVTTVFIEVCGLVLGYKYKPKSVKEV